MDHLQLHWVVVCIGGPTTEAPNLANVLVVRAPAADPGALARPTGMRMNWTNKKGSSTHGARQGGLFTPICPEGYGHLGSVGIYKNGIVDPSVVTPADFPSLACVSTAYLKANGPAHQPSLTHVWDDEGSGCDYKGSVWAQPDLRRPGGGSPIKLPFVAGASSSYAALAVGGGHHLGARPVGWRTAKCWRRAAVRRAAPARTGRSSEPAGGTGC